MESFRLLFDVIVIDAYVLLSVNISRVCSSNWPLFNLLVAEIRISDMKIACGRAYRLVTNNFAQTPVEYLASPL